MSSLGGSIYQFPGQHSSLTLTWLEWLLFLKGTYCLKAFVITHDLCIHSTKKRHAQRHVILSFLKLGLSAEVHRLVQTCILTQDVISSHIWHLCIHVEQLIRKLSSFFSFILSQSQSVLSTEPPQRYDRSRVLVQFLQADMFIFLYVPLTFIFQGLRESALPQI